MDRIKGSESRSLPERLREATTVLDEPFHRHAIEGVLLEAADALQAKLSETEELKAARAALRDACEYFTRDADATVGQRLIGYGKHAEAIKAAGYGRDE